jgi:hypothetical protein
LKYNCLELNGNKNGQLANIYCKLGLIPYTKFIGSYNDLCK